MVKRIGWIAPVVIASMLAAFLFLAAGLTAQQAAPPQAMNQMVPDNPSDHTPLVQQVHICLYHYICARVEALLT